LSLLDGLSIGKAALNLQGFAGVVSRVPQAGTTPGSKPEYAGVVAQEMNEYG
jgi:hypothetical protein